MTSHKTISLTTRLALTLPCDLQQLWLFTHGQDGVYFGDICAEEVFFLPLKRKQASSFSLRRIMVGSNYNAQHIQQSTCLVDGLPHM